MENVEIVRISFLQRIKIILIQIWHLPGITIYLKDLNEDIKELNKRILALERKDKKK